MSGKTVNVGYVVREVEVESVEAGEGFRKEMGDMDELKRNIAENGLLQPIIVRESGKGEFELIAGFRRLTAVRELGWEKIPAVIIPADEKEALIVALSENEIRKQLNDMEIAEMLSKMQELGLKQREIAKRLGRSPAWVSQKLKLLKLPEKVQEAVKDGKMSGEAAVKLSKADEEVILKKIEEAEEKRITIEEAEEVAEEVERVTKIKEELETKEKELEELREKLREYDKAEEQKRELEKEREEIEGKIKEIDNKLRELSKDDVDFENLSDKLSKLESEHKSKTESVKKYEEALKEAEEKLENVSKEITVTGKIFNAKKGKEEHMTEKVTVSKTTAEEHLNLAQKYEEEIRELEKKLKEARSKRDYHKTVAKEVEKALREKEKLEKGVNDLKEALRVAREDLRAWERQNFDILKNEDYYRNLAEKHQELVDEKVRLVKRLTELKGEMASLTSKINNRKKTEKKTKEVEKEIEKLKVELMAEAQPQP